MIGIKERLDSLRDLMQSQELLEGKGLSNEVNIRMFCYDPSEEMTVRHFIKQILTDHSLSCHLIEFNLYKIFLAICSEYEITDKISSIEEKKGKDYLLKQLNLLATNTTFVEKMQYEPHEYGDVILVTGVGEAYPFIRIHSLLDAMQSHFSDIPVIVMYPGTFDGHYVTLFNKLKKNPYYRAFNVI